MDSSILSSAIEAIKNTKDKVVDSYDGHIREKAIEDVNEKIREKGLDISSIAQDDYEAMVSDLSKDIRENYAQKATQGLLAFVGLDLLFGW